MRKAKGITEYQYVAEFKKPPKPQSKNFKEC